MKKIITLAIFALICSLNTLQAQGGGQMDPAQMLEMMKQRVKPGSNRKNKTNRCASRQGFGNSIMEPR
jgi:hypothetical protein